MYVSFVLCFFLCASDWVNLGVCLCVDTKFSAEDEKESA